MFLSVIIPVYNVENYLRQCVDSILSQTFRDFELILVDNGSTDSCGAICDEYQTQDTRVVVKHLMPNIMASGARNEGLKMATGDYILFIDSDDYYCTDKAFEMLKEKSSGDPDVILFKSKDYYESNGSFGTCSYSFAMDIENKSVEQICSELIDRDGYSNSAWSKTIRRSILIDNDIWFTPGLSVEDNDWYYRVVLCINSVALLDEVIHIYRRRTSGSITSSGTIKNVIDCLDIIDKWMEIIDKAKDNPNSNIIRLSLAKQYCNYLIGYASFPNTPDIYSRFKKLSFLLDYSNNKRVKVFRSVKNVVGLKGLIYALKIVKKLR